MVARINPASSNETGRNRGQKKNMRFRIRTIMIAVVFVGLVLAFVVLWRQARDEIRRAHVEIAVARELAIQAETRALAAEARAQVVEQQAKAILERSSQDAGDLPEAAQKSPTRRPNAAR
jgi:hypothetical protein